MATDFELFINTEIPRRSPHLTVEITGYNDDPNAGNAPDILKNAPKGTWYLRESPDILWYRKQISGQPGATSWVVPGGGTGSSTSFVLPANCLLTDQVGHVVHVTGDEIAGRIQTTRADITSFLGMPAVGVIINKTTPTECDVQWAGAVRGIYSGLTPGRTYFLGSDSLPSAVPPTPGVTHYVQKLGIALGTETLLLMGNPNLVKRNA